MKSTILLCLLFACSGISDAFSHHHGHSHSPVSTANINSTVVSPSTGNEKSVDVANSSVVSEMTSPEAIVQPIENMSPESKGDVTHPSVVAEKSNQVEIIEVTTNVPVAESNSTKQFLPPVLSSFASQMQSQMSGVQSQLSSFGGNVMSQVQSQMSSAQSQMAAIPSTISGLFPLKVSNSSTTDPSSLLGGSINETTALAMDVDEHIKKYIPSEGLSGLTNQAGVKPKAENQPTQLSLMIDQVNTLSNSIESTVTDLVSRGRNVTAAMLRSTLNYVRRIRTNLETLQTRLQLSSQVQNSTVSEGSVSSLPGSAIFNPIRDRINRMTEEISALVNRIRGSFIPAVELTTIAPVKLVNQKNHLNAAVASGTILSTINSLNTKAPTKAPSKP